LEELPNVDDIEEDNEAEKIGDYVKKFNSMVRTTKIKNKMSIVTPVNVKLYASNEMIESIKKVENDVKITLKINSLEYIPSQDREEVIIEKYENQPMGV